MPAEKKQSLVADLAERLSRSRMVILADYRGLDMKGMTGVRRALERSGAGFHVVKNTLFLRALEQAAIVGLDAFLEGPTAVAFAYEDAMATAKALQEQASSIPMLRIKGAWMEGSALSPDQVRALAALPPREILLARVMGTVQSPVAGLVNTLAGVLRQLLYVLQARSEGAAEQAA